MLDLLIYLNLWKINDGSEVGIMHTTILISVLFHSRVFRRWNGILVELHHDLIKEDVSSKEFVLNK